MILRIVLFIFMLMPFAVYASTGENKLRELLGQMPERKPLQIDTLESVKLEDGIRYKIRYFIESGNPALGTPDDWGTLIYSSPRLIKTVKCRP